MIKKCYVGIDPGKSGGIASITETASGIVAKATKMPETDADIFDCIKYNNIDPEVGTIALIEKVHSMPKQGVVSTFTFGKNFGALKMALTACGMPFMEVTPQKWQRGLDIPKKKKEETQTLYKTRLKEVAQQLFPDIKVTKAISDALLIAWYNYKINR